MEIINGVEVVSGAYILDPIIEYHSETFTDDHTVTVAETGRTLIMSSTSNKTFTLFTPAAADVGKRFTFANVNTGRMTIAVAGTGVQLNNGTATSGTMYSDDDYVAAITIEVVSATKWTVIDATGTWTTT